ncbi:MAG: hypothetical protein JSR18_10700, partial [Proteobacteria bacterium]|nr:hypothetical protein [Pseudomonadota bacterium]
AAAPAAATTPANTSDPAAIAPAPTPPAQLADAARPLPDGPVYWCAVGDARTEIITEPSLARLCRRAPEMGPCQYERNACRRRGGTVLTGADIPVTPAVEAEYDRRVLRVTLNAEGRAAPR